MILHTTISGIPARVLLTYHAPLEGGLMDIPVEEHFTIEGILDSSGNPAKWLDAKMTVADEDRIIREAFDQFDHQEIFKDTL